MPEDRSDVYDGKISEYFLGLLDALEEFQRDGYTHRMVVPENIFIEDDKVILGNLEYARETCD